MWPSEPTLQGQEEVERRWGGHHDGLTQGDGGPERGRKVPEATQQALQGQRWTWNSGRFAFLLLLTICILWPCQGPGIA